MIFIYTEKEKILKHALEDGIINLDDVLDNIMKQKKSDILKNHPYPITYCESDGRWHSFLYDETKRSHRKSIAKKSKEELEKIIIDTYHVEHAPTFEKVYKEWKTIAVERKDISKSSADRYDNDYVKFYEPSDFVKLDMEKIQERDIILFIKEIQKLWSGKITRKCYCNIISLMKNVFSYALTELDITSISISSVLKDIKLSKRMFKSTIKKDEEQVFSLEESELLANYILNNYTSTRELGVLLALLTGVRVGELVGLKITDQRKDKLFLQRSEIKEKDSSGRTVVKIVDYCKTSGSENSIILSESAQYVLSLIRKENLKNGVNSEYLFYEEKLGRLNRKIFDETIRKLCKKINILERSMHKLRKTYASNLFAQGVEEKIVQSQLRHSDSSTTHRYYEFSIRNEEYKKRTLNDADFLQLCK